MFLDETLRVRSGIVWRWLLLVGGAWSLMMFSAHVCSAQPASADPLKQGQAFLENGERDKAIAAFSEAIRLKPKEARAYYLRASVYQRNGDADKAGADLTRAIELDPKGLRDYFERGWAYGRNRDLDNAIAMCTESIRTYPDRPDGFHGRGFYDLLKGEFDQAVADFTAAIRLHANDLAAHTNRGLAYLGMGEAEKAIADQTEAIRIDPRGADPFINRAWAYAEKGDFDKAIADSAEALRLNPNSGEAYAARGYALEKKGEREKAKADYAQAIKLEAANSHELDACNLLAWSSAIAEQHHMFLPAYWLLWDPDNRKRIQISPEQEKKLREIATKFQEEYQRWWNDLAQKLAKLPPEQQEAETEKGQLRQQQEQLKVCRKRVEEVLTPQQLDQYKKYALASMATWLVAHPAGYKTVGFTPEQREKLRQIDKEFNRQGKRERKEQIQRLLAVLTVPQREKLRAEVQRREFEPAKATAQNGASAMAWTLSGTGTSISGSGTLTFGDSGETVVPAEAYLGFLPVYSAPADATSREELGLTATQQKQLAEIAGKFHTDQEKLQQNATKQPGEYLKSEAALEADLCHRIGALLTAQQLADLKEITFRDRVPFYFQHDFLVQERIGLSEPQKAALREILRDAQEKYVNREYETYEKLLGLLAPQQQEKLREVLSQGAW